MNLPNILTLCRIALVVLYTAVLAVDGLPHDGVDAVTGGWFSPISVTACIALWAFVVAAITLELSPARRGFKAFAKFISVPLALPAPII